MTLGVTAKLKLKTSLTDVPFAVNDAQLLAEMGWNIWDNDRSINDGHFSEGIMRKLISKYTSREWVSFYNHYVQDCVVEKLDVEPCIHILDCTKIPVNLENENYEEATVVKLDGETFRYERWIHIFRQEKIYSWQFPVGMAEASKQETQNPGNPISNGTGAIMGKRCAHGRCPYQ